MYSYNQAPKAKTGGKRGRDEDESPSQKLSYKKTKMADAAGNTEMDEGYEAGEDESGWNFDPKASMEL